MAPQPAGMAAPSSSEVGIPDAPRALWWDAARDGLALVDQTRLPAEYVVVTLRNPAAVAEAIRTLRVRGAPAIGVAAAYGLALAARAVSRDTTDPLACLHAAADTLRATRPTAVNLAWALDRVLGCASACVAAGGSADGLAGALLAEADVIAAEDAAACLAMGHLGATLIHDGDTLLTHCNAGALATAGIGTALAPIYVAHAAGKRLRVYVDETRPVLQGARLTAWELARAGIPLTLITDSMAAHFMRHGNVRAIFVGADRIAANGDTANKIGTYGLAVLAHAHGIPLYVVAPRSTIDRALPSGDAIPIEQRPASEVTRWGERVIATEGIAVANPAFDVTPAALIAAIITEAGVCRAPLNQAMDALFASAESENAAKTAEPLARSIGGGAQ